MNTTIRTALAVPLRGVESKIAEMDATFVQFQRALDDSLGGLKR